MPSITSVVAVSKFSFTNGYRVEEKFVVGAVEDVEYGDKVESSTVALEGVM